MSSYGLGVMVGLVTRLTKTQGDPTHIDRKINGSKDATMRHDVEPWVMTDVADDRNM